MSQAKAIEGTPEELAILLQSGELTGHKLVLLIDPVEDDGYDTLPTPPFTVRNREHLIELLREGFVGSPVPATKSTWTKLHDLIDKNSNAVQ